MSAGKRTYTLNELETASAPRHDLAQEFAQLQAQTRDAELQAKAMSRAEPFAVATSPDSFLKNAFLDIMPYDHNRLSLPQNRYLNASLVRGYDNAGRYIAAQGPRWDEDPKRSSAGDFFSAMHHLGVNHVLMLCQEAEIVASPKCGPYWGAPGVVHEFDADADVVLRWDKSKEEVLEPGFTRRVLEVTSKRTGEAKNIYHYQFSNWMDYDTPGSVDAFMRVLKAVDATRGSDSDSPLAVHCRAGIGRTGTFIAVHDILTRARALKREGKSHEEIDISVFDTVERLRKDRAFLVQQPGQYAFIYRAVAAASKEGAI